MKQWAQAGDVSKWRNSETAAVQREQQSNRTAIRQQQWLASRWLA